MALLFVFVFKHAYFEPKIAERNLVDYSVLPRTVLLLRFFSPNMIHPVSIVVGQAREYMFLYTVRGVTFFSLSTDVVDSLATQSSRQ